MRTEQNFLFHQNSIKMPVHGVDRKNIQRKQNYDGMAREDVGNKTTMMTSGDDGHDVI